MFERIHLIPASLCKKIGIFGMLGLSRDSSPCYQLTNHSPVISSLSYGGYW